MMPYCQYKRCKNVAEEKLGVIKEYEHPYLCLKHFKKILSLLRIKYQENGDYR
jgi:hypothetical protein